jgi:hypothetical protein
MLFWIEETSASKLADVATVWLGEALMAPLGWPGAREPASGGLPPVHDATVRLTPSKLALSRHPRRRITWVSGSPRV